MEEPETVTHEAAPAPSAPAPVYAAPNRPSRTSDARPVKDPTAGLVEAAERMRLDLLATTAPGSAVDDALRRSNIPAISLTQAQADAPLTNERELTLHSTGPIDPSLRRTDLSTVVTNTHKDGNDHVAVRDTPGPQYSLDAHPVQTTTHVSNAERTISSLRAGFRRCYEQGLQKDPQMSGDVTIRAHIRSTGEVDSTAITAQNGLSPEVAACIVRKVASAEFDKPEGGSATIDIPVKFVKQR